MSAPTAARRLVAEGLATTLLLAAVVGSGIMGERLAGGNVALALLANALATGAALVVLITCLGPLSGAHMNPVVSLVECLAGRLSPRMLPAYLGVQVLGAIAGVWLAHAMFDLPILMLSGKSRGGTGAWVSEFVATFGLVLTILCCLRHRPHFIAVAVGAYITAAYWFTASTSFANPAVTLARALTDSFAGILPADVPAFVGMQLAGGLAAAWLARWLLEDPPVPESSR